jgi:transcription elongation factor Elf1
MKVAVGDGESGYPCLCDLCEDKAKCPECGSRQSEVVYVGHPDNREYICCAVCGKIRDWG